MATSQEIAKLHENLTAAQVEYDRLTADYTRIVEARNKAYSRLTAAQAEFKVAAEKALSGAAIGVDHAA